jgi:hypothetical protein
MQGTESKKPGVYRGKCKNDRYKTGWVYKFLFPSNCQSNTSNLDLF